MLNVTKGQVRSAAEKAVRSLAPEGSDAQDITDAIEGVVTDLEEANIENENSWNGRGEYGEST